MLQSKNKTTTKESQARTKTINPFPDSPTLNGKSKDWIKARIFMESYLFKEKYAIGIPRSYLIKMDEDKPDPVTMEDRYL